MKSKLHSDLQEKARNYLLDKSYWITDVEVMAGNYGSICDVWGMRSEIGNFETCGIEVKVSRADFKKNKPKEYRTESCPMANRHYILCPTGLIKIDEVHPKWGLLWWGGNRIVNKKQAGFVEMSDRTKLSVVVHFLCSKLNKVNP